jgi:predicted porin
VGIGSWNVGASAAYYQNYSKDGYAATFAAPSDDGWVVLGGCNYTIGQWQFGLQGMYSLWQELGDTTHEAIWGVSLNGIYAFTDSFSIDGQIAYTYADYGNVGLGGTSIPNVHGIEVDLGTNITF